MNANKVLVRGIKVGIICLLALFIIYGTMKASFAAYEYGYRFALESLMQGASDAEDMNDTESKEEK